MSYPDSVFDSSEDGSRPRALSQAGSGLTWELDFGNLGMLVVLMNCRVPQQSVLKVGEIVAS